jgi:SagB-type dehydrogenase family enzyme
MKLRRARAVIAYWNDSSLAFEHYLTSKIDGKDGVRSVEVNGLAVDVLSCFSDWTDPETIAAGFKDHDPATVLAAVKQLFEVGLLQERDGGEQEERLEQSWRFWGHPARFFFFGTKNVHYLVEGGEDQQRQREMAKQITGTPDRPAIFARQAEAPRVYLPRAFLPLRRDFDEVLLGRRTHREFAHTPVGLRELSTVLHYTFAPMYFVDAGEFGTLMLKTSPSGGARHETECYVAALTVQGVQSGLYHYSPEEHSLVLVSERFGAAEIQRLTFGQPMVSAAGFVCFLTARFDRSMYKYRNPRALRTVLLNTGHLAQTFALCCTAVGLGPMQTDAFRDNELEDALGIDGIGEAPLYVLGAGVPAGRGDGMPPPDLVAKHPT